MTPVRLFEPIAGFFRADSPCSHGIGAHEKWIDDGSGPGEQKYPRSFKGPVIEKKDVVISGDGTQIPRYLVGEVLRIVGPEEGSLGKKRYLE